MCTLHIFVVSVYLLIQLKLQKYVKTNLRYFFRKHQKLPFFKGFVQGRTQDFRRGGGWKHPKFVQPHTTPPPLKCFLKGVGRGWKNFLSKKSYILTQLKKIFFSRLKWVLMISKYICKELFLLSFNLILFYLSV